ncbi:glutamate synthase subunit beta [Adhaeribacter aquaticus]|uniref:glutamate synthase subunit beta n=1 Tax=Adhaeribacter aquaticus TaxID=299567 RepID=UPI00047DE0E7|nr:glutamate synthase subunit beta [Adhaeribacter aquaticus]
MGKPTGFLEYGRELPKKRDPKTRINDYNELYEPFGEEKIQTQAARCMDCGVPFCHSGCPLGNIIPEFNDAVYEKDWEEAARILFSTNNFPEFTGRICPAPCEASCVLGINKPPVAIEEIEKSIAEAAFEKGYVRAKTPIMRTGKKVAVVGSGPAGLAAAAQLNSAGHSVTVFERADKIGGLLRYGIPDFKLEKWVIDRRLQVMEEEGVEFRTNANVGENVKVADILRSFDAIVLTGGSTVARDLPIPGRNLKGVHFAMEFLTQQNGRVAGKGFAPEEELWATDKHVVVIGGGDTGSDCVGTSNRHGAKSIMQVEVMAKPPQERDASTPWPNWPMQLRTSTSHEEGCDRNWGILTKEFVGDAEGHVKAIKIADMGFVSTKEGEPAKFQEVPGTEREVPCDLALLAIGFVHPQHKGMLEELGVDLDERGNVKSNASYQTSVQKVFAAGDMRRGQSLVVWAISEGREAARNVDLFLMGETKLEAKDVSMLSTTHAYA